MKQQINILRLNTLLLITILTTVSWGQTFEWVKQMGGTNFEMGKVTTVDADGNIYTSGLFNGMVDFDPGAGVTNLTSLSYNDIFIQKLDNNGDFVWAKQFGSTNDLGNDVFSITTDNAGNIYASGHFKDTVDFDPGPGVFNLTTSSIGDPDVFMLKLDEDGDLVWAKELGGDGDDIPEYGQEIRLNDLGEIYIAGTFRGTDTDFDPGVGIEYLSATGGSDQFILKLDAAGEFLWAQNIGGVENDWAEGMEIDASGNIFVTGIFTGEIEVYPGGVAETHGAIDVRSFSVAKYDSMGNLLWFKSSRGTTGSAAPRSIVTDNMGDVYVVGTVTGKVDYDPGAGVYELDVAGSQDVFVLKLNPTGDFVWAHLFGASSLDLAFSIVTDIDNNVYFAGEFRETVDFDPSVGMFNVTAIGVSDIFVCKLDKDGNLLWVQQQGSTDGFNQCFNIYTDGTGGIYTTGTFHQTIDFDFDVGTSSVTSIGSFDIFIQKWNDPVIGVSVAENEINSPELTIYPNPAQNMITVESEQVIGSIEILDQSGRVVIKASKNTINIENLSQGVYIVNVHFKDSKSLSTKRILKR